MSDTSWADYHQKNLGMKASNALERRVVASQESCKKAREAMAEGLELGRSTYYMGWMWRDLVRAERQAELWTVALTSVEAAYCKAARDVMDTGTSEMDGIVRNESVTFMRSLAGVVDQDVLEEAHRRSMMA